ncbi:MAG: prepilin-type N-terminal cleavage/methylation domain-containing protein [Phycisphaerales bacterium]
MKKVRGFTLVELLVVISIIAVLLAVLIPSLQKAREIAKRAICATQIKQIGVAISAYIQDYDNKLPFYGGYDASFSYPFNVPGNKSKAEDEGHPYAVFRDDKTPWMHTDTTGPVPMKLACLYVKSFLKDAKVFYCPSNRNPLYRYDSYVDPLRPENNSNEWGTLPQAYNNRINSNQWVRVGYAYYPMDETIKGAAGMMKPVNGMQIPAITARKFAKLDRRAPYLTDVIWQRKDLVHRDGIDKNTNKVKNAGLNALFKDGHAKFVKDQPISYVERGAEYNERLLDNRFWNSWDPPRTEDKPDGLDASYILYNTYRFIN